ncbi:hypothetical protein [Acetobacterium wieringae]|uniref:hypothetical protein n=1 Tax=Acetobacterium wieringae TaxID=52694 RepID=UPI0026EA6810|nr:hypothetical protein [Acetobacterium wieringae]
MKDVVIKKIPIGTDIEKLLGKKPLEVDSSADAEYSHVTDRLSEWFKPRAILKECSIKTTTGNTILIGGHVYKSKILKHLLSENQKVFLYLLTIGDIPTNLIQTEKYLVNSLKLPVMTSAMRYLKKTIQLEHGFDKIGMVNPGLLPDWSIKANQIIFNTFGNTAKSIGMEITKHSTMRPLYSSSGILFEDLLDYCDCQTCPIDACIGREARFVQSA